MNCRGLKPQHSLLRGFKSILFANSSGAASRIPGHLPSPGFFIHGEELQLEQLTRSHSSIPPGARAVLAHPDPSQAFCLSLHFLPFQLVHVFSWMPGRCVAGELCPPGRLLGHQDTSGHEWDPTSQVEPRALLSSFDAPWGSPTASSFSKENSHPFLWAAELSNPNDPVNFQQSRVVKFEVWRVSSCRIIRAGRG